MKTSVRMGLGVLVATAALAFAPGRALAQDPVKITPKDYKVLLENDKVRVLEFRDKSGGKEAMHSHPAYVVYSFTDSKRKITTPDGKSEVRELKAGQATWREAVTHATVNVGTSETHVLIVEIRGPPEKMAPPKKY